MTDKKEYQNSLCITTFDDEYHVREKMKESKFLKITGKSIFQHPRTKRTAHIKFITNYIQLNEMCVYFIQIFDIIWQNSANTKSILKKVETLEPCKKVERDGTIYLACPMALVFGDVSTTERDINKQILLTYKSLMGVNISYSTGEKSVVHRSLLIPEAIMNCNVHSPKVLPRTRISSHQISLW